jgi:hypothetical protein
MSMGYGPDQIMWSRDMIEGVDQEIDAEKYWPRPIPVSERLPEAGQRVLVFADGEWHSAVWGDWVDGYRETYEPSSTHWLPIPPKPE